MRNGKHAGTQEVSNVRAIVEVGEFHGERSLVGRFDEVSEVSAHKSITCFEVDADPDERIQCKEDSGRGSDLLVKGGHQSVRRLNIWAAIILQSGQTRVLLIRLSL